MAAANVKDVAVLARVSMGTVSNVLNRPEIVSPETAERVLAAIAQLGFVRNEAARQLKAGRSKTIGLVVLDVGNPFFTDVARGAEAAAGVSGLSLILGNSDESEDRENAYLDLFEQQRVHGVLISPATDVVPRLEILRQRGIPAVLVDRSGDDRGFSSVSVDDVAGGRMAVDHLIAGGRKRIAIVLGSLDIRQVSDRLQGAREAVEAADGVTLEVVTVDALTVIAGRAGGQQIVNRDPSERPDAVFAVNDLVALGVLQALVMTGDIAVPAQIALIGYDDIDFASSGVVPLSSIRQPSRLIGQTAVEILLDEVADPGITRRQIVFQPELVARQSTAS